MNPNQNGAGQQQVQIDIYKATDNLIKNVQQTFQGNRAQHGALVTYEGQMSHLCQHIGRQDAELKSARAKIVELEKTIAKLQPEAPVVPLTKDKQVGKKPAAKKPAAKKPAAKKTEG